MPLILGTPVTALRCSKPFKVMQYNMGPTYDNTANIDTFQMWIPSLYHCINYTSLITPHNEDDTAMQNTEIISTWPAVSSKILVDSASVGSRISIRCC